MLSALQQRVAALVSGLPEAEDFALAGAAALIIRGEVARVTADLDFFATMPASVERLVPALEAALTAAGLQVERATVTAGFARLLVTDAARERTTIDLCWDSRLRPTEASPLGPTLAGEELAASKMLALFTRAEARDFIDVVRLARRYGFERLCELAEEKDPGFHLAALADALASISRIPRRAFDVDDETLDDIRGTVNEWRSRLRPGD